MDVQGLTAYSIHPGIVATGLQSGDQGIVGNVMRQLIKFVSWTTPLEASYNTLFVATSPEAVANAGGYFEPVGKIEKKVRPLFGDQKGNDALWELGNEQMIRILG